MIIFDAETNGFLENVHTIHCIVAAELSHTGDVQGIHRFNDQPNGAGTAVGTIKDGLDFLANAERIAGHNILDYDIRAIQRVYPDWSPRGEVLDTLVLSRLYYADLKNTDFEYERRRGGKWISRHLYGKHSIDAWGQRLGQFKGTYVKWCQDNGVVPFADWTPQMEDYCEDDVEINVKLWLKLVQRGVNFSEESISLEHAVSPIIRRMCEHGWAVDVKKIETLYATLQKRSLALTSELQKTFVPFYVPDGTLTPKRDNRKQGYTEGAKLTKVKLVDFNPGSNDHIANRLKHKYNWRPRQFTPSGKAQIDEAVLKAMKYAEAPLLDEYKMVEKRMGMLMDGKSAWMKYARKEGAVHVVHPIVIPNGAVTGRMSHSSPNFAQVTRPGNPYGKEMRECWIARFGRVLVGCDADGIEMRALAHYMARWDDGAYANAVIGGKKEDGTDAHTLNALAMGLVEFGVPTELSRDTGKTIFYAMIYGAGDYKIGQIAAEKIVTERRPRGKAALVTLGREIKARLARNLPAMAKVINGVRRQVAKKGYLKGLDGRLLEIRSEHSAVNTLFQSFGAIIMKRALVIADTRLQSDLQLHCGNDYEWVGNIHDEMQNETLPELAEKVGTVMAQSIVDAGGYYNVRCPQAGSYSIGTNWSETH